MSDETPKADATPPVPETTPPPAETSAAAPAETPADAPRTDLEGLEADVIAALKTIFDPEIPVNIYELGLIYGIAIDAPKTTVDIQMTLTSPACPVAGSLPGEVELKVQEVEGINKATVELVWDPPWSKDLLSEAAKLTLGLG